MKFYCLKKFLLFTGIGLALGLALVYVLPTKYRVISMFKITNEERSYDVAIDAKNIIYTSKFSNEIENKYSVFSNMLPPRVEDKINIWRDIIKVDAEDTSIKVEVEHGNVENAVRISEFATTKLLDSDLPIEVEVRGEIDEHLASPDARLIIPLSIIIVDLLSLVIYFILAEKKIKKGGDDQDEELISDSSEKIDSWLKKGKLNG